MSWAWDRQTHTSERTRCRCGEQRPLSVRSYDIYARREQRDLALETTAGAILRKKTGGVAVHFFPAMCVDYSSSSIWEEREDTGGRNNSFGTNPTEFTTRDATGEGSWKVHELT